MFSLRDVFVKQLQLVLCQWVMCIIVSTPPHTARAFSGSGLHIQLWLPFSLIQCTIAEISGPFWYVLMGTCVHVYTYHLSSYIACSLAAGMHHRCARSHQAGAASLHGRVRWRWPVLVPDPTSWTVHTGQGNHYSTCTVSQCHCLHSCTSLQYQ